MKTIAIIIATLLTTFSFSYAAQSDIVLYAKAERFAAEYAAELKSRAVMEKIEREIYLEDKNKGYASEESAKKGKWSVTAEDNFIFKKKLGKSGSVTGGEIKNTNQVYGKIDYALLDNLSLYAKLGAGNLEQRINWDNNRTHALKCSYGFLAGGGARFYYPIFKDTGIGADTQFNWWHSPLNSISGDNSPVILDKGSFNNFDSQTALYLDYKYVLSEDIELVPCAGIFYSYFRSSSDKAVKYQDNKYIYTIGDIESNNPVGFLLGLSARFNKNTSLNIKARFIAETAITGSCSYEF